MDFDKLPYEIKQHIVSFLRTKELKNMARCSKQIYEISCPYLWRKPRFIKSQKLERDDKLKMKNLHIKELHSTDLRFHYLGLPLRYLPKLEVLFINERALGNSLTTLG